MTAHDGWTIDLSGWTTMKPVLEWQRAARAGHLDRMAELMAGVVRAWPFEGSPADVAAYEALTPDQFAAALREVGGTVGNLFQG